VTAPLWKCREPKIKVRVSDPYSIFTDLDPAFETKTDPDPAFLNEYGSGSRAILLTRI